MLSVLKHSGSCLGNNGNGKKRHGWRLWNSWEAPRDYRAQTPYDMPQRYMTPAKIHDRICNIRRIRLLALKDEPEQYQGYVQTVLSIEIMGMGDGLALPKVIPTVLSNEGLTIVRRRAVKTTLKTPSTNTTKESLGQGGKKQLISPSPLAR
jgi:hypothetical protein